MQNNTVKIGVSERQLQEQGVETDSQKLLPQMPDLVGYALGLMLLWLAFTGYQVAVRVMEKPMAKISEEAVTIKATVEEFAAGKPIAETGSSPTDAPVLRQSVPEEGSGWTYRLEKINSLVNRASQFVAGSLEKVIFPRSNEGSDSDAVPNKLGMSELRGEAQRKPAPRHRSR